jgi:signal transduction histidine kinase
MARVKRIAEIAVIAFLVPLFLTLAVLQYRWLTEVSDAEHQRMRSSLYRSANDLSSALTDQYSVIRALFRIGLPEFKSGDLSSLSGHWRLWRQSAEKPGLVKAVFLVRAETPGPNEVSSASVTRLDPESGAQLPVARFSSDLPLGDLVESWSGPSGFQGLPCLVIPVLDRDDAAAAQDWVVVAVDRGLFEASIVQEAVSQSFGSGQRDEYRIAILRASDGKVIYGTKDIPYMSLSKGDAIAKCDLALQVFLSRQDEPGPFLFFWSGSASASGSTLTFNGFRGKRRSNDEEPGPFGATIVGGREASDRSRPLVFAQDSLVVLIAHKAGSLEGYVRASSNRNIAVAFGILLVLGAALSLTYFAYRRARALQLREREFVASVSHELRTPLAVIRAASENLADGIVSEPEKVRSYGATVGQVSRRLSDMVERVLSISILERADPPRERFDLVPLAEEGVQAQTELATDAKILLEFRKEADSLRVRANREMMRSALRNLVVNAVIHGGEGNRVLVSVGRVTRGGKPMARLEVRDWGRGIPRREARHVFEAFYRGTDSRENQRPGSGLGLAIVKRAVVGSGGKISLETASGKGCQFTILLEEDPNAE